MNSETPPRKWARTQRFGLSEGGTEAGTKYREMIVAARATAGRESFDAARAQWADSLHLEPGDGAFLGELLGGALTIDQLAKALEDCGTTRDETRKAVDRLTVAGLLEALPLAEPGRRRY